MIFEKLDELIKEADNYSFENNSGDFSGVGIFSRPSSEMLAWTAECQDLISSNFGNKSAPWDLFEEFDRNSLYGNGKDQFETQIKHIVSALKASKRLVSKSNNKPKTK